jgi:hypothetical protein
MHAPERRLRKKGSRPGRLGETLRRAFAEFLTIPSMVIAGFLVLAAGTYALDHAGSDWLEPLRALLRERIFRDAKGTSDLLATVAGSLITVTSITFSLLLLTVQQSASTLTNQVYDQFLLRRINQIYFGFFVGLSLYTLVILATVAPDYNPVFGATFAFLLTIVALYLIILLLYTTIDQMRPAVIIDAIRGHIRLQVFLADDDAPDFLLERSHPRGCLLHRFVDGLDAGVLSARLLDRSQGCWRDRIVFQFVPIRGNGGVGVARWVPFRFRLHGRIGSLIVV